MTHQLRIGLLEHTTLLMRILGKENKVLLQLVLVVVVWEVEVVVVFGDWD